MKRNSRGEKKDWSKLENVDMDFDIWVYNIAKKRYADGRDKRLLSFRIITRALQKISILPEVENIMLTAEIKDDRWKDDVKK